MLVVNRIMHLCYNERDQRNLFSFFLSRFKTQLTPQGRHNIERKIYHIRFRLLRLLKFGREVTSKRRIKVIIVLK